jgi:GAF domain-containing protein
MPEVQVGFDSGLVGRCASLARRGAGEAEPEIESEPLPLSDGAAIGVPLFVRRFVRGNKRVFGVGVLYVVVPQDWLRDEMMRRFVIDISISLAQYLYAQEAVSSHEDLLASVEDLQRTMATVTTTRGYGNLLFAIAEGAKALMNVDMSKVLLLDDDRDRLLGVAWAGMDDALGSSLRSRVGVGLSGLCAKNGVPTKSSNLVSDQRVDIDSSQALRSGMRAELCVPIRAQGELLGVLSVMSSQNRRFTQEEEYLLGTLAGQAGAAILNVRSSAAEERQLQIAQTMREISLRLSQATDERETLTWILEQIKRTIPHDSASVLLLEGDQLRLAAAAGFAPGSLPPDLHFPLRDHRLMTRIAADGAPLRLDDTTAEADWLPGPTPVRSWIGVPIRVENTLIGLLGIDSAEPRAFGNDDVLVAERFAVQCALAVRTARLYQALRAA